MKVKAMSLQKNSEDFWVSASVRMANLTIWDTWSDFHLLQLVKDKQDTRQQRCFAQSEFKNSLHQAHLRVTTHILLLLTSF